MGNKTGIRKHKIKGTSKKEKDKEVDNNDNTGNQFYENICKNKVTQVDKKNLGEKKKTKIKGLLDLMKDKSGIELRGFNKVDRSVLVEWSRQINGILKHIRLKILQIQIS